VGKGSKRQGTRSRVVSFPQTRTLTPKNRMIHTLCAVPLALMFLAACGVWLWFFDDLSPDY
jgi:hypothetical protein